MKFTKALTAAMVVASAVPHSALAWGYEGHKVVAAIARAGLTPTARAEVDALLAADADTLAPHNMLDAATWADTYRNSHRETSQWHFVDIELAKPDLASACFGFPAPAKPASAGPAQDCIVDRLGAFTAELADPNTPQAEKILALKFVLHFVGDIHQPLHASDNEDHGGNCVHLALGGSRTTNLHSYWDTAVVEALGSDPEAVAAKLRANITPSQKAAWESGDAKVWALESFGVARSTAYTVGSPPGCDPNAAPAGLPAGYEGRAQAAAEIQLERAGVRLAWVLNHSLGRSSASH
jgi:hypothetical protein